MSALTEMVGEPGRKGHDWPVNAPQSSEPTDLRDLPLRERKFARTKVALLKTALEWLRAGRRLENISVREICAEVQVAEGTFFNYFPKKSDLLLYYVQLWTLEASARAGKLAGLAAVEEIFRFTGERMGATPTPLLELVAKLASDEEPQAFPDVSRAERLEAFPDLPETLHAEVRVSISSLFRQYLEQAVQDAELPAHTDVDLAVVTLSALFFGTPLVNHCSAANVATDKLWAPQLRLIWMGLRATPAP